MSADDGLREAIARWLWAMDATPGAVWDEWPDEHAEYLSKADDYAADLPWLAALRAKADAADRAPHCDRCLHVKPGPHQIVDAEAEWVALDGQP